MSNALLGALQQAMESALSDLNIMQPGEIVSYDPGTNRAIVRPALPKMLPDGSSLPAPLIYNVPVQWMAAAGGVGFTAPLKRGDVVELRFAQRSLEGWLSGNNDAPDDPRRSDLADCVATPIMAPGRGGVNGVDVELAFGPSKLRLTPDGSAIFETGGGKLTIPPSGPAVYEGDMRVTGKLEVLDRITTPEIVVNGVAHSTHRHQAPNGTTQGPISG